MPRSLSGRFGTYEIVWWYERRDDVAYLPVGDLEQARSLLRSIAREAGTTRILAAILQRGVPSLAGLDDDEVMHQLAVRMVSGRVRVARRAETPLYGLDAGPVSEPPPPETTARTVKEKTWIEIELLDMAGNPVPHERYWIRLTDGTIREGNLDDKGRAYFGDLDPGACEVRWPALDGKAASPPGVTTWARPPAARPPAQIRPRDHKTWIEIVLSDMIGKPVPDEPYRIKLPSGAVVEGTLDGSGRARVDGIEPGECEVTFPRLDESAWEQIT